MNMITLSFLFILIPRVMDLKRISSRIICSDNITRQNLNKEMRNVATSTADDDDQFFTKIKSEIDKNLLLYSNQNYRPNLYCDSINLTRKKRPIIDEETQNVIKRFKRDSNHFNSLQSPDNANVIQRNPFDSIIKETRHHCDHEKNITNVNTENILQHKNMFSTKSLNANFRIPPNKYIFQMTSKKQTNVLPLPMDETTIVREEYEESLFYGMMFLTPPDSNSIGYDEDS